MSRAETKKKKNKVHERNRPRTIKALGHSLESVLHKSVLVCPSTLCCDDSQTCLGKREIFTVWRGCTSPHPLDLPTRLPMNRQ